MSKSNAPFDAPQAGFIVFEAAPSGIALMLTVVVSFTKQPGVIGSSIDTTYWNVLECWYLP